MTQSKIFESYTQSTILLPDAERSKISCRVTNSTLKYVESLGYDVTTLIDGLSVSKEYLANPLNWVPALRGIGVGVTAGRSNEYSCPEPLIGSRSPG